MSHERVYVVLDLQAKEKALVQAIATQSGIKATRTDYFYARRTKDNADAVAAELDVKLRGLSFQLQPVER